MTSQTNCGLELSGVGVVVGKIDITLRVKELWEEMNVYKGGLDPF